MAKRTPKSVPALVDEMAQVTGKPESTLRHIARRAREAGHLSQAGHGPGAAKATAEDAAVVLLVSMTTESAIHAGFVADALADLTPDKENAKQRLAGFKFKAKGPVEFVTEIIDGLRKGEAAMDEISSVMVQRGPSVYIRGKNIEQSWEGLSEGDLIPYPLEGPSWSFEATRETKAIKRYQELPVKRMGMGGITQQEICDARVLKHIADWLEGRTE